MAKKKKKLRYPGENCSVGGARPGSERASGPATESSPTISPGPEGEGAARHSLARPAGESKRNANRYRDIRTARPFNNFPLLYTPDIDPIATRPGKNRALQMLLEGIPITKRLNI